MLDRWQSILKIFCLALAALLLFQMVQLLLHIDPLGRASIPPLPTLARPVEGKDVPTNIAAPKKSGASKPDSPQAGVANAPTTAALKSKAGGTNATAPVKRPKRRENPFPGMGGPAQGRNLPPPIQFRVDRIQESEILAPFIRPLPLALLGIADDDAFLRAPDGRTGLVKEGGELAGIKLLRIGINRVLIEQDGEKKELTLFDGFGGESLLPKAMDPPTNATPMPHQKDNP